MRGWATMTSRLLMPYRSAGRAARSDVRRVARPPEVRGSTRATEILDWADPGVTALVNRVRGRASAPETLRVAHRIIAREIRPVYSVEDRRRVSATLRLGRGSCSQRMAVLEAVARAVGIRTRVRGLLVDGVFWYPRFPRLKPLVPRQVLLAWPEFRLEGAWVPIGELFGRADHAASATASTAGVRSTRRAVTRLVTSTAAPATATIPSQMPNPWSGRTESVRTIVNGMIPASAAAVPKKTPVAVRIGTRCRPCRGPDPGSRPPGAAGRTPGAVSRRRVQGVDQHHAGRRPR
jgi:transglutaminase-like putative cysteine protease